MNDNVITKNRVAVITGAAHGIGAAMARKLAQEGMQLSLFDSDGTGLTALVNELPTRSIWVTGNAANPNDLQRLFEATTQEFGDVALLVNNVATKAGAGPWDEAGAWWQHFQVNFFSVITLLHLFVPYMQQQNTQCAIVNLGSKEGITTPPGNAAYSVGKAAIKVLTEQLSHELRIATNGRITAHLLIPGYTWTPMNFPGMDEKRDVPPAGAWTANQVIDHFVTRFRNGDFYILCPDNEVTSEVDSKRILWASQDITENRPALSRWHPDWQNRFNDWLKS